MLRQRVPGRLQKFINPIVTNRLNDGSREEEPEECARCRLPTIPRNDMAAPVLFHESVLREWR